MPPDDERSIYHHPPDFPDLSNAIADRYLPATVPWSVQVLREPDPTLTMPPVFGENHYPVVIPDVIRIHGEREADIIVRGDPGSYMAISATRFVRERLGEDAQFDFIADGEEITMLFRIRQDERGCLDEFVQLDTIGPDEAFADRVGDFITRFGWLEFCEHSVLSAHAGEHSEGEPRPACNGLVAERQIERREGAPDVKVFVDVASAEQWLRYIRHLRAVMSIVAAVQHGDEPDDEDWRALEAVRPSALGAPLIASTEPAWFGGAVGPRDPGLSPLPTDPVEIFNLFVLPAWITLGRLDIGANWVQGTTVRVGIVRQRGAAGLLAQQLIAAMQRGIYRCAECQRPFAPPTGTRKPAKGRRAWCPTCGERGRWRTYSRERYAEQKAERETAAESDGPVVEVDDART